MCWYEGEGWEVQVVFLLIEDTILEHEEIMTGGVGG